MLFDVKTKVKKEEVRKTIPLMTVLNLKYLERARIQLNQIKKQKLL